MGIKIPLAKKSQKDTKITLFFFRLFRSCCYFFCYGTPLPQSSRQTRNQFPLQRYHMKDDLPGWVWYVQKQLVNPAPPQKNASKRGSAMTRSLVYHECSLKAVEIQVGTFTVLRLHKPLFIRTRSAGRTWYSISYRGGLELSPATVNLPVMTLCEWPIGTISDRIGKMVAVTKAKAGSRCRPAVNVLFRTAIVPLAGRCCYLYGVVDSSLMCYPPLYKRGCIICSRFCL